MVSLPYPFEQTMRNVAVNKFPPECMVRFKIEIHKHADICLNISWEGIVNIRELTGGCPRNY